jgi:large subunit ribosomal protein L20
MVRVKRGNVARKRRKKLLNRAKGFRGSLRKLFRPAKQAVVKAQKYATRDRRARKRVFRRLWITRISSATKELGISYSKFISALKKNNILIDRKMLSEIAISDPAGFSKIVEIAKK